MFNISFAELIVILLLAFLILGPAEMAKVARFFGKVTREAGKALHRLKAYVDEDGDFDDVINDVEDVKRDLKAVEGTAKGNLNIVKESANKQK